MRTLIYALVLTLTAALFPVPILSLTRDVGEFPSIISAVQFPQTNTRFVRHSFKIQMPNTSNTVSQLMIDVPSGLTVANEISIHERSGRKIEVDSIINRISRQSIRH